MTVCAVYMCLAHYIGFLHFIVAILALVVFTVGFCVFVVAFVGVVTAFILTVVKGTEVAARTFTRMGAKKAR